MASQLQLRRGTTAQHVPFIGAPGEVTVDTDKKVPVVHDGTTAGGFPVLSASGGTMTGPVSMGGSKITSLATPTAPADAAPKGYVDGLVAAATLADADYGDITVSGAATVWTIDSGVVNAAKLASSAVETAKINNLAVTTAKIADLNVTTAKIADLNVTTAKIADANVTNAKLASGIDAGKLTTGTLPVARIADGGLTAAKLASNAVETAKIANAAVTPAKLSQPLTIGTFVSTTSGTSIDFTGIPSWVKKITVLLNQVSLSGDSSILVRIGAGSIATSGYLAGSHGTNNSGITSLNGFPFVIVGSAISVCGAIRMELADTNTWISTHGGYLVTTNVSVTGGGVATIAGNIDRIRITTVNGTNTFDGGGINIMYEG